LKASNAKPVEKCDKRFQEVMQQRKGTVLPEIPGKRGSGLYCSNGTSAL